MKIGILGGGPAGMTAAIQAAKRYSDVTLIDWNLQLGRKLASTGGGRGNLTNVTLAPEAYNANEKFAFRDIILEFNYKFIKDYFSDIGIFTYQTDDGWVYPISNSAKNISEYFSSIINSKKINVVNDTFINSIVCKEDKFYLRSDKGQLFIFDKIIIATGGKAYPKLNSSDLILRIMKELGHDILPSHPALAPLKTSKMKSDKLNGVRLNAQIIITKQDDTIVGSEMGNIIFTEWGINGPGVMNLSHKIHDLKEKLNILIKFNYDNLENLIEGNFYRYRSSQIPLRNVLLSLYPAKLIDQMIYNSELNSNIRMIELSEKEILRMKENLTIKEKIIDTRDFNFSQISTGSISSRHVNTRTLESKLISGLFFAGEILDVIGPCGGYNLHWAFVSGIVAGNSI